MIIYGYHKQEISNTFIVNKLNQENIYWNYKLFTDHLNTKDLLVLAKSLVYDDVIFLSLESGIHGLKYKRPYKYSSFNITHKNLKNSIYYNLFAEDFLNNLLPKKHVKEKSFKGPVFIASNYSKIKYLQDFLGSEFSDLDFFSTFASAIKDPKNGNRLEDHISALDLTSQYKSAICIENSEEIGYIQGNFQFALLSGTVPIIKASKFILNNILLPDCYIELSEYYSMSKLQRDIAVDVKSEYILSGNETYTNLAKDYLQFLVEMDLSNISSVAIESQRFKKSIFEL
jgi:hypothetical protein